MAREAICQNPNVGVGDPVSIHVRNGTRYAVRNRRGEYVVTGVWSNTDDSATIWYEKKHDSTTVWYEENEFEEDMWEEDTIPSEHPWEDEEITRHDDTNESNYKRKRLDSVDEECHDIDEISGMQIIKAIAMDKIIVGSHVRLITVKQQKIAIEDKNGDYTVIMVKEAKGNILIEVTMRIQDERLEKRQILQRLQRGRICGPCGQRRVVIDKDNILEPKDPRLKSKPEKSNH